MLKTKLIKTSNYIIKILIIILSFGFIGYRLFYKHDISELYAGFIDVVSDTASLAIMFLIFMMMFLNWGIETLKWQYLIRKIEKVSFIRSFMTVWAGITIGSFTPNRSGEFFSRAFILEKANRWEGIFITFIGSLSQQLPTMLFGTIACFFFLHSFQSGPFHDKLAVYFILLGISLILTVLFFILYFRLSWLKFFFLKLTPRKFAEFRSHLNVYTDFSFKELFNALLLSIIRYIVFAFQFYMLIRICNIDIPFVEGIMLISLIYLIMTAIPTFALTELGVRGSVSILVLEMYFQNTTPAPPDVSSAAFLAASLIWFINLIIPAIIGGFFVFKLKFFRK